MSSKLLLKCNNLAELGRVRVLVTLAEQRVGFRPMAVGGQCLLLSHMHSHQFPHVGQHWGL